VLCTDVGSPGPSEAVAYQIDAAHTGWQPNDVLTLPLRRRWSHDFGTSGISYPLVAMDRVFVTVENASGNGTQLFALNAETGAIAWGPVALSGSYNWSAATYADRKIFVINFDGLMTSYDGATGQQLWATQMNRQYAFSSAPTAFGGRVYVGGAGTGGTVFGVDASTGTIVWTRMVQNGDDSSPAVSAAGVYVSYVCNNAYAFRPTDGAPLWSHSGSCEGGGGKTVALIDGRVYTRDSMGDLILDAAKGTLLGSYASTFAPAGANGFLYTVNNGQLYAAKQGGASPSWSFGNGNVTTPPIVIGQYVVIGTSSGELDVISVADGSLVSSDQVGTAISAPDQQSVGSPLSGLAAANNGLYVPAGSVLYAY
jgi:outer membrane protein assembly factor BamB